MVCPTAKILFDNFASAAMEHFEATDKLSTLVGQHSQFEEQKECAERAYAKCSTAHLALTKHWTVHGCRGGIANGS